MKPISVIIIGAGYRAADIQVSVKNHLIGFAAEQSRHTNTVVDLNRVCAQYGFEI